MESGRKFLTRAGKGREGEEKAADYLQGKGYGILARNFHSRTGELDIVAVKDGTVAFIEVKSWRVFGRSDEAFSGEAPLAGRDADTFRCDPVAV
jgi:hypothetical protein